MLYVTVCKYTKRRKGIYYTQIIIQIKTFSKLVVAQVLMLGYELW